MGGEGVLEGCTWVIEGTEFARAQLRELINFVFILKMALSFGCNSVSLIKLCNRATQT